MKQKKMDDQILKFNGKSYDSHKLLAFESVVRTWTTYLTPSPPVNYHEE